MRRNSAAAIIIAVAIAVVVNYFALQAIMAMPCDTAETCNQRNAGVLVVATDVFATVIVV